MGPAIWGGQHIACNWGTSLFGGARHIAGTGPAYLGGQQASIGLATGDQNSKGPGGLVIIRFLYGLVHRLNLCLQLTSKTASNSGRDFFKCANPAEAESCLKFMWKDQWDGSPVLQSGGGHGGGQGGPGQGQTVNRQYGNPSGGGNAGGSRYVSAVAAGMAEWNLRDRLAIRLQIREQMLSRNLLTFAEDDPETVAAAANHPLLVDAQKWAQESARCPALIAHAVSATSTDDVAQGVENTVVADAEFWSSTGSLSDNEGDALLYRLTGTLCQVTTVRLALDPLYPPRSISFWVGPSPSQLYPASPMYPVKLTDAVQVPTSSAATWQSSSAKFP
eukprot:gene13712-19607_t